MRTLPVLIFLVLFHGLAGSQNIYTALQLNREREYKTKRPVIIKETNIFYNAKGKEVEKATKTFDNVGMLSMEEWFDDNGNLKGKLTIVNDTANRLILSRAFEGWTEEGNSKYTIFYFYDDDNHLTGITTKDANGITEKTLMALNDKGQPIELTYYDGGGQTHGKEVATYFDEQNLVVTSRLSDEGKLLSTDTIKMNFVPTGYLVSDNETYNDKGDLVRWKTRYPDGTETIYEQEYTYDAFGNCTETSIYKVTFKANGNKKRKLDRVFKKEYTY